MTNPDYRAMCARMADELDYYCQLLRDDRREVHALATEARALLAQPVAEGLTDKEIMGLMPQQMHDDLAAAVRAMAGQEGIDSTRAKGVLRIILNRHVVDLARAVLARWGRQPAPPAEGEVGELVALILQTSLAWGPDACLLGNMTARQLTRAAELLQQRPEPVPVSERPWEREGFCDVESCCWAIGQRDAWCRVYVPGRDWGNPAYTYCLPATALPLPAGEGK
jgi:hypothetical protein